jgi:hypothetical protein
VVIENKGGAGGVLGTDVAAKSAPTLHGVLISVAYAFAPALTRRCLRPATAFARSHRRPRPSALTVHPSVPVNSSPS